MFIYDSHIGDFYVSTKELSQKQLFCEQCGDWDSYIGEANTREEAWALLKSNTDINGSGGWCYEYVQEFLDENFGNEKL